MPSAANPHRRGRIQLHERNTDDTIAIIGEDVQIDDYDEVTQETLEMELMKKTRNDYRRRIKKIINYWKEKYPDYIDKGGVRQVPEEEMNDPTKYFFAGKYREDIVYSGINYKLVIKCFADLRKKENGTRLKTHGDIRKYNDAIKWAANVQNVALPTSYYKHVEKWLKSFKKEVADGKGKGLVDKKSADPITFPLYHLILKWAIEEENMMVWVWTLLQWSFIARSISIDPLAFHNIRLGMDSLILKYDTTKMDKEADKLSERNLYANPLDFSQCVVTGLGVHFALNQDRLSSTESFFLNPGTKNGTAAGTYQEQLLELLKRHLDEVKIHIRNGHFNAYGLRKGSSTFAATGTTQPPSTVSIARRGEWSIGKVLDCYWMFGEPGDQYLGRILAGLDPTGDDFAILPPHFTITNPMSNEHVNEAMQMTYGRILSKHMGQDHDPSSLLLRCLASLVHHSEQLVTQ